MDVAAPTENDASLIQKIQKVETKMQAPKMTLNRRDGNGGGSNFLAMPKNQSLSKASINQVSGASLNK